MIDITISPPYLAVGDSITAPRPGVVTYVDRLMAHLPSKGVPRLVNLGFPGANTATMLAGWTPPAAPYRIATIMLGVNDHYWDQGTNYPEVSQANYRANLIEIHRRIVNLGCPSVIFLAPTFVANMWPYQITNYVAIMADVAAQLGCLYLDTYAMTRALTGCTPQLPAEENWIANWTDGNDGIHPNSKAHFEMYKFILPAVLAAL